MMGAAGGNKHACPVSSSLKMGISPMSLSPEKSQRWDRASLIATFIYQGLVILAFLVYPILAYQYINTPFIGAFIDNTMVVNGVHPEPVPANWDLTLQGAQTGDQLLVLDGTPGHQLRRYAAGAAAPLPRRDHPGSLPPDRGRRRDHLSGHPEQLQFQRPGRLFLHSLPRRPGVHDHIMVDLRAAGAQRPPGGRSPCSPPPQLWLPRGLFDVYTTHRFLYLWGLVLPMVGAGLIHLGLVFPQEARFMRGRPYLRWIGYGVAALLAIYGGAGALQPCPADRVRQPLANQLCLRRHLRAGVPDHHDLPAGQRSLAGGEAAKRYDSDRRVDRLRADNPVVPFEHLCPAEFQSLHPASSSSFSR